MSSELLENVEDDKGVAILLTYYVNGFASLTTMEPDTAEGKKEGQIVSFSLVPNKIGWYNAKTIADALQGWIEHTKEICSE